MEKNRRMKIIVFSVLFFLVFAGIGLGAYLLNMTDTAGMVVYSSGQPLELTVPFDDLELNTTLTSDSGYTNNTILNYNGDVNNVTVGITIDEEDLSEGSCNSSGDITETFKFNGVEVNDQDQVVVVQGTNNFEISVDAVQKSCEVQKNYTLSLTE